jgi:hypothetical protein
MASSHGESAPNPDMVGAMREPEFIRQDVMRNDAYIAHSRGLNFRACAAAYNLLKVTGHPLIDLGPGDPHFTLESIHWHGERTYFQYAPIAVLLAGAGFRVEVVASRYAGDPELYKDEFTSYELEDGWIVLGHLVGLEAATVVEDHKGEYHSIELVLE